MSAKQNQPGAEGATSEFVTVTIAGQLFGLPIMRVHDVFMPDSLTRVPLAPPDVAGVLNLRGRIVTAISMRRRLGLPAAGEGTVMAVGVDYKGEAYGLVIDAVGEVLRLPDAAREANPANLDPVWAQISAGIYRLEGRLMVILDVDRVLDPQTRGKLVAQAA
jgi:purine-binding chemotaxis protein CheW